MYGALIVSVLALAVVGCTRNDARPRQPNVLLITFDTTRRDHCSVYGYERRTTPTLELLGAQGVVFDAAYAASSSTGPSHATLFTGLYPLAHGVVRNGGVLSDDKETLAERLVARGWQTAAFVSSFVLARRFGWAQGFEVYDDEFPYATSSMGRRAPTGLGLDRRAAETTSRAVRWLEQTRDPTRPFFLFVHYFDPHDPYDPPPPFAGRFRSADGERRREGVRGPRASADERVARALAAFHRETARPYDEEIAYADDQLARLLGVLDRLGLADDTIVVMTADHGEGLGQHGWLLHGVNVYEELVRVPLLVRWPRRIPARRVSGAPVEQVDIVPTVLDLVGLVPVAEGLPGRNLAAALRDVTPFDRERPVFLTRRLYEPRDFGHFPAKGMKFAVRLGRWKYIVGQEEKTRELFDLEADPGELRNRVVDEPERATALADLLARWQVTVGPPVSTPALGDEDTARRLRALGYTQ